jgi:D-alanyl-D-alanine carboxypeptidase/D-alanyl-D-alanine-endopeptidase (penicillin-binding protein 4)
VFRQHAAGGCVIERDPGAGRVGLMAGPRNGRLTRRALLGGALGAVAGAALAEAPLRAIRPVARPEVPGQAAGWGGPRPVTREEAGLAVPHLLPLAEVVAAAGLGGITGVCVADMDRGTILEEHDGGVALPPASVAKALTAIYARASLAPGFRFETRLVATGPVAGGIVQGDLVLAGGGDPQLVTDDLAELAGRLRAAGVRGVTGAFGVWGGALPFQSRIDPGQLDHLGYNPSVGGLNLNFNRVHFEWTRSGGDWQVAMDARSDLHRPAVTVARMEIAERDLPVYTYADGGGVDRWTVARGALGEGGSRWLPVRYPALYAGEVMRVFAQAQGIDLPAPREVTAAPEGEVVARWESPALDRMIGDMLEYSTNITAEALGLSASRAGGAQALTLAQSAAAMGQWARGALGAGVALQDHSGLSDASRVAAREMVLALVAGGRGITGLMKRIALTDEAGEPLAVQPGVVEAKTGTLNFVNCLAGTVRTGRGADLAFAIFSAEPERRARAIASADEVPDGSREWARRARRLQQVLLQRWAVAYPA